MHGVPSCRPVNESIFLRQCNIKYNVNYDPLFGFCKTDDDLQSKKTKLYWYSAKKKKMKKNVYLYAVIMQYAKKWWIFHTKIMKKIANHISKLNLDPCL